MCKKEIFRKSVSSSSGPDVHFHTQQGWFSPLFIQDERPFHVSTISENFLAIITPIREAATWERTVSNTSGRAYRIKDYLLAERLTSWAYRIHYWQQNNEYRQRSSEGNRLRRTRYRRLLLDAWFWVVLLRVLRFPPQQIKERTKQKKLKRFEKKRKY